MPTIKASDLSPALRKRLGVKARNKYGVADKAERTADGIPFDSKKEMHRYMELVQMQRAGSVKFFLRQVPFHLPGGVVYRADFLVVYVNGDIVDVNFEDVKGMRTKEYLMKKKMVEAIYPVKIREL